MWYSNTQIFIIQDPVIREKKPQENSIPYEKPIIVLTLVFS